MNAPAPRSIRRTKPMTDRMEAEKGLVDQIAQWLHDEAALPDPFMGRSWPLHDADTGAREGGGHVKLVPMDLVEEYRNVVRRMLRGFPALLSAKPEAGGGVREAEVLAWFADRKNDDAVLPTQYGRFALKLIAKGDLEWVDDGSSDPWIALTDQGRATLSSPSTAEPALAGGVDYDFRPDLGAMRGGREPSLRSILLNDYGAHFSTTEAKRLVSEYLSALSPTAPAPRDVGRCLVTGNPVGTDTRQVGHPCRCAHCAALSASPAEPPQDRADALPADVARLVVAARTFAYGDPFPEDKTELDKATEAFADRVPWDDEPPQEVRS